MHILATLILLLGLGPFWLPVVYGGPDYGRTEYIGSSAQGRPLTATTIGNGPVRIAFVGGLHGAYEGNTTRLIERAHEHFAQAHRAIPPEVSLTLIAAANPDGLAQGSRFNGHTVDLNRNWDYKWTPDAYWTGGRVSAGAYPFSEPETRALRDLLVGNHFAAVVFYHSAEGAVYPGSCSAPLVSGPLGRTIAAATGYRLDTDGWDYYPITGQAIDYLDCGGIPAADVELPDHDGIDWTANLRGMQAVLAMHTNQ
jgi:hypothetical protein